MNRTTLWIIVAVVVVGLAFAWPSISKMTSSDTKKWPSQDITVVVPYPPGGGTDLTTRALVDEMAKELKVSISVVNTPGASGSVGTINAWNKPHDGYTIAANGFLAFTSYPVMGYTDKTYKDYHLWVATFSPNVIATKGENAKYADMKALMDALKANPGQIPVGTAGVGTGGHLGMEVVKAGTKLEYKHVPYQGGAPAIVAGLSGEVDVVPQLSMEMIDMFKAGKLKGLAVLMDKPMKVSDKVEIPSILQYAPDMKALVPMGESFGIMVPKDTPEHVVKAIDAAFKKAVQSETMKKFADQKGVVVLGLSGDQAQAHVGKLASIVCWTLFDGGTAKISPERFGIPRLK